LPCQFCIVRVGTVSCVQRILDRPCWQVVNGQILCRSCNAREMVSALDLTGVAIVPIETFGCEGAMEVQQQLTYELRNRVGLLPDVINELKKLAAKYSNGMGIH